MNGSLGYCHICSLPTPPLNTSWGGAACQGHTVQHQVSFSPKHTYPTDLSAVRDQLNRIEDLLLKFTAGPKPEEQK